MNDPHVWRSIDLDRTFKEENRVMIFSPCYPNNEMRYRIVDAQFVDRLTDATHWMALRDPE